MFETVPFVAEEFEDGVTPRTTFYVRPLTVGEMMDVNRTAIPRLRSKEPVGAGTRLRKIILHGLQGWENFSKSWSADGTDHEVAYARSAIDLIPYIVLGAIAQKIFEISVVDDAFEEELRDAVRAAWLRGRARGPEDWNCENCVTTPGLQRTRRCPFLGDELPSIDEMPAEIAKRRSKYFYQHDIKNVKEGRLSRWMKFGGHAFAHCPIAVQVQSPIACDWVGLVMRYEQDGSLPADPPVWSAQPYFFAQIRNIVADEKHALQQLEKKGEHPSTKKDPKSEKKEKLGKKSTTSLAKFHERASHAF